MSIPMFIESAPFLAPLILNPNLCSSSIDLGSALSAIISVCLVIFSSLSFSAISWFKNQGVKINERSIERDFQCCMNMYDCSKIGAKKIDDLALSSPLTGHRVRCSEQAAGLQENDAAWVEAELERQLLGTRIL